MTNGPHIIFLRRGRGAIL